VVPNEPLKGVVDADARVRSVNASVTTKGMYFAELVAQLDEAQIAAVWPTLAQAPRHGKYQPFLDYPFADALRWLHAVAAHKYPRHSLLEGLRRLGRDTVLVFLSSRAGQVVKEMNLGPRDALLRMPAMWKVTDPSHSVTASEPEPGVVHFDVRGFPGWLDCGLIGTLEQVVISRGAEPEIQVDLAGPEQGAFSVRWYEETA
jgi:uncharacterized protein (TIGR02265 family)